MFSFIFVICIGLSAATNSKVKHANFLKGSGRLDKDNMVSTTKTKSEMDCGAQCLKRTGCSSFAVDGSACVQFRDDSGVLQKKCPSSSGYEEHTLGGGWHCLKYNASLLLNAEDAKHACAAEGAHLLIPQTRTFLDDLQTMFTQNGHGQPIIFISGEDIYSNLTYHYDDGSVVPATLFAPGEPDYTLGFLRVELHNGLIRSGYGGYAKKTLCQIY